MAPNEREIQELLALADEVVKVSKAYAFLSDDKLRAKTNEFRMRLNLGETEEEMLVETFAVAREASRRIIQVELLPDQIACGIALARGRSAEIGSSCEDTALVCALPAYLQSLSGKGMHLTGANDDAAKRACELMEPMFEFLDVTVGLVLDGMTLEQRAHAYAYDITYGAASEFGLDYLRDGMASTRDDIVQRGLHSIIVDETDLAPDGIVRTPLAITREDTRSSKIYEACNVLARRMKCGEDADFTISGADKKIQLTEDGMYRIERYFRILNVGELENLSLLYHMQQALYANYLMNEEYVQSQPKTRMIASIAYQTFFNKYEKTGLIQNAARLTSDTQEPPTAYDEIIDTQRDIIFEQRHEILFTGDLKAIVTRIINASIEDAFERAQYEPQGRQGAVLAEQFGKILDEYGRKRCTELEGIPLLNFISDELFSKFASIEKSFDGSYVFYDRMRLVLLESLDTQWLDHLEALDQLCEVSGFLDLGAVDPDTAYKNSASGLFDTMRRTVRRNTFMALLHTANEDDAKLAVRTPRNTRNTTHSRTDGAQEE